MATNQGDRQASVRAVTGTAYSYEGDFHALFDAASIPAGQFNGRMLAWINAKLGTSYTDLNGAMNALAVNQGAKSWNEMGAFTASSGAIVPGKYDFTDPTMSGLVATLAL